jgi:citrate lyase gamma subunit
MQVLTTYLYQGNVLLITSELNSGLQYIIWQLVPYDLMVKKINSSHNALISSAICDSFVLYKRISEQYVDQDILEYIRTLIPEEIVRKTRIEIEDKGCLKSVLQWFKKDFMQWVPRDQKCERCNLLMSFHSIKGNSWK